MSDYWDKRFRAEGRIWGDAPSATAALAEKMFRERGAKSVLVPGAGYGRHTAFFAERGYAVTGIEVSAGALALARPHPAVALRHGSVLDFPYAPGSFDAVYCFNVLHLFLAPDRARFLEKIFFALSDGGIAFFAVFSEEEPQYGKGPEVEPNTFESKPGRPVHFFTEPSRSSRPGSSTTRRSTGRRGPTRTACAGSRPAGRGRTSSTAGNTAPPPGTKRSGVGSSSPGSL
jgi:SAM-dependent methyltransferase